MGQNKYLGDLFAQKMNRKEFLARIGVTLLALAGISGFLKSLSGLSRPSGAAAQNVTSYGGGDSNPNSQS